MENVVMARRAPHLERTGYLPETLFGFRPNISMQYVLLHLKDEVVDCPSVAQTRAILVLDLKGAFDNVSHDLILQNLNLLNCSKRIYKYIRAFLRDRTATLGLGDLGIT